MSKKKSECTPTELLKACLISRKLAYKRQTDSQTVRLVKRVYRVSKREDRRETLERKFIRARWDDCGRCDKARGG